MIGDRQAHLILHQNGKENSMSSESETSKNMAQDHSLSVDGATLFYRVRGSGPLLLILPGGDGDADTADALRSQLIDRFTVVTYDRRGMSRSKINAPGQSLTLLTHSDDAQRLLAVVTNEPAFVFGSSIGALIGLDLVARHPEQVSVLVAHEPPAWDLLPDGERNRAMRLQEEAEDAFRREGAEAGFKKFVALAAVDYNDREPDAVLAPPTSQRLANLSFFFTCDSPAVRRYSLDLTALRASPARIVPAVGRSAPESALYKATEALAAELGEKVVAFPGGHTGWLLRPKGFAAKLDEVLARRGG
jgi:pimeloyl-ACP methyl ester carboxylesterase